MHILHSLSLRGGGASTCEKMREGREKLYPFILDSLILNEPEKVKKSIVANKSYGITYHTALKGITSNRNIILYTMFQFAIYLKGIIEECINYWVHKTMRHCNPVTHEETCEECYLAFSRGDEREFM